jgi:excisionase family DNA binding protein
VKTFRSKLMGSAASSPQEGEVAQCQPLAVSVEQAADQAGVSRTFLYERISSGELPTIKLGKRRLVRVEALRRWLLSLETWAA